MTKFLKSCVLAVLIVAFSAAMFPGCKNKENSAPKVDGEPKIRHEQKEIKNSDTGTNSANPATDEPPEHKDDYTRIVTEGMKAVSGKCQWGYCVFPEGKVHMSESVPVPSASVIKVFIMEYVFEEVSKGELSLSDSINGQNLETLVNNMITYSDNSATNAIIDYFGMEKLNAFFEGMGYADTRLERRMLDTEARSAGKENYTSVNDVMNFLCKLYSGKDSQPCNKMLEIMKKQQIRTKIPKKFEPGTVIANKTGELDNVENDIGIIFGTEGDVAVAFLCTSLSDTAVARDAISTTAYSLAQEAVFKD